VPTPTTIRLLVAEDVPQVSQHVRNLLSVQSAVKLLEVLNDGSKVVEAAKQLRPDVVMVDLLLQGKVKGPQLIEKLRDSGLDIPVVVLTVPQHPLARDPARGIDAVLTLPFSGFELVNTLSHVLLDRQSRASGACRVITVFSPKDYVFSGSGFLAGATALVKAGPGRLTINTTNSYTGPTTVSGGTLIVNGSLDGSPVTVERRGTPEGPARFGGSGRLGQGLTVQKDCGLIVGPDTNTAGPLTVSNNLVGAEKVATIPTTEPGGFFRLRQP